MLVAFTDPQLLKRLHHKLLCVFLLLPLMVSVVHSSSSQALGTPLGVAYQMSFLADIYIIIHNSSKISYKVATK